MPTRTNSLKLNPLQLRTLTLLQALALIPEAATADEGSGEVTIRQFPHPHGDHFHLGDAVVSTSDASGLANEAVWNALTRKGLARSQWPSAIVLTKEGLAYETGLADVILHRATH